jgi:hypothetical protein
MTTITMPAPAIGPFSAPLDVRSGLRHGRRTARLPAAGGLTRGPGLFAAVVALIHAGMPR